MTGVGITDAPHSQELPRAVSLRQDHAGAIRQAAGASVQHTPHSSAQYMAMVSGKGAIVGDAARALIKRPVADKAGFGAGQGRPHVLDDLLLGQGADPEAEFLEGAKCMFPVEDAVNTYLANLDFKGIFRVMDLTDAIQAVSGVVNAVATTIECKTFTGAYSDILVTASQSYTAYAGYMKVDSSFPLASQLNYIVS